MTGFMILVNLKKIDEFDKSGASQCAQFFSTLTHGVNFI